MKKIPALALGAALMSGSYVAAQQAGQEPDRQPAAERQAERQADRQERQDERQADRQTERRVVRQNANSTDQMFANCLAIDNAAEAQVAEFAAQRLQNEQAKEFAQMMVRDHRAMLEKLNQFGAEEVTFRTTAARTDANAAPGDVTVRTPAGDVNVDVDRDRPAGEARREDRREARVERRAGEADFVSIKREIAEQCIQSAQEELSAKPANDVDRCFMAAQVFGHQHMLDALKVMERHASPDFKQTLAQASQTTQQHLDQAKQILKSLDSQHASPETQTTSGTTNR